MIGSQLCAKRRFSKYRSLARTEQHWLLLQVLKDHDAVPLSALDYESRVMMISATCCAFSPSYFSIHEQEPDEAGPSSSRIQETDASAQKGLLLATGCKGGRVWIWQTQSFIREPNKKRNVKLVGCRPCQSQYYSYFVVLVLILSWLERKVVYSSTSLAKQASWYESIYRTLGDKYLVVRRLLV